MNGDSTEADSRPIFASSSNSTTHKLDQDAFFAENRTQHPLFMAEESDSRTNYSEYGSCNSGQNNSGLLRFRSAPSSLLENFASGVEQRKKLSSRFCSGDDNDDANSVQYGDQSDNKSGVSRMGLQLPPQYPRQSGAQLGFSGLVSSMAMDQQVQGKLGSGLMRQNSSPAGLFSQNGYVNTRGIGSYRLADDDSSRLKNGMNFSSGMSSSLGILSRIAEVDEAKIGNSNSDHLFYGPGFAFGSWSDSSNFTENFATGIKRELENDLKIFAHPQNSEPENMPHLLSHHLSLPKNSAEMANVEKLLHFQDTIPCKIRAKRGCATHPRSIAERVRRTRISERMRKLQDLVPNMDKQTNTADMLDLAVDYIKNLQNEYKTLSETRANCKCLPSQKTMLNQ